MEEPSRHVMHAETEALSRQARDILRANATALRGLEENVMARGTAAQPAKRVSAPVADPGLAARLQELQGQVKELLVYKERYYNMHADLSISQEKMKQSEECDRRTQETVQALLQDHEDTQARLYERATKLEKANARLEGRMVDLTAEVDALRNDNHRLGAVNANLQKEAQALQCALQTHKTRSEIARQEGHDTDTRQRSALAAVQRELEEARLGGHEWQHKYQALKEQLDAKREESIERYAEHQRLLEKETSLTADLATTSSDLKVVRETNRLLRMENVAIPDLKTQLLEATRAAGEVQSLRCQCDQLRTSCATEKRAREELVEQNQILQCRVDDLKASATSTTTTSEAARAEAATAIAHLKAEGEVLRRKLRDAHDTDLTAQRDARRRDAAVDSERAAVWQVVTAVGTELRYLHSLLSASIAAFPRDDAQPTQDVAIAGGLSSAMLPTELAAIPPPELTQRPFAALPAMLDPMVGGPAPLESAGVSPPRARAPLQEWAAAAGDDLYTSLLTLRSRVWEQCARAAGAAKRVVALEKDGSDLTTRCSTARAQQQETSLEVVRLQQLLDAERNHAKNAQDAARRVAASLSTTEGELESVRGKHACATEDLRRVLHRAQEAQIESGLLPAGDADGNPADLTTSTAEGPGDVARAATTPQGATPAPGACGDLPVLGGIDKLTYDSAVFVVSDFVLAAVQYAGRQKRVITGLRARVAELQAALADAQQGIGAVRRETQQLLQLGDERSTALAGQQVAEVEAAKDAVIANVRFEMDKLRHQLEQTRTDSAHFETECHSLRHEVSLLELRNRSLTSEVERSAEHHKLKTKELADQHAALTEKHSEAMADNAKQAEVLRRTTQSLVLLARALYPQRARHHVLVVQRNLMHREARDLAALAAKLAVALVGVWRARAVASDEDKDPLDTLADVVGAPSGRRLLHTPRIGFRAAALGVLFTLRLQNAPPSVVTVRLRGDALVTLHNEPSVFADDADALSASGGRTPARRWSLASVRSAKSVYSNVVLPYPPADTEAAGEDPSWVQQAHGVGDILAAIFPSYTRAVVGAGAGRRRSRTGSQSPALLPRSRRASSTLPPAPVRGAAAALASVYEQAVTFGAPSRRDAPADYTLAVGPSSALGASFAGWMWNWGWGAALVAIMRNAVLADGVQRTPPPVITSQVAHVAVTEHTQHAVAKETVVESASEASEGSRRGTVDVEEHQRVLRKLQHAENALQAKADESRQLSELMAAKAAAAKQAAASGGARTFWEEIESDAGTVDQSDTFHEGVVRGARAAVGSGKVSIGMLHHRHRVSITSEAGRRRATHGRTQSLGSVVSDAQPTKRASISITPPSPARDQPTVREQIMKQNLSHMSASFISDAESHNTADSSPRSLRQTSPRRSARPSSRTSPRARAGYSADARNHPQPPTHFALAQAPTHFTPVAQSAPVGGGASVAVPRAISGVAMEEVLAYISALDARVDRTLKHTKEVLDPNTQSTPSLTLPLDESSSSTLNRSDLP